MPDQTIRPDPGQLALELPSALPDASPSSPSGRRSRGCGATRLHPMCSYLASFPAALAHAFIARYSRPGDVVLDPFAGRGTAPVQAAAEGRIGVGNDLNPLAHVLTAAKLEPATLGRGADAARRPAARLGRRGRALARPRRSRRDATRPPVGVRAGRRQRRRSRRPDRARPRRGQRRVPPADARPGAARPLAPAARRPDGPVPGRARWPGSSTARRPPTCRRSCPTRSAWRRATSASSSRATGFQPPERDVFDSLAAKLDRLYRQPLPATAGISLLGDARDGRPPLARRAAGTRPARSRPPRRHLAALPARAQVRLLQLAADVAPRVRREGDRRGARRRPPARAVPRVPARRPRRPPPGPHRRRHRRRGHRRRGDRPRQARRRRASGSPRPSGRRPPTPRATGSPASSGTRSPPTAR